MTWGLLTVIVIGLLILFAAPYLSFLAPGDHIWLVDTTIKEDPVLLAIGSETLWIQWQSWGYIFLFSIITAFILGLIYNGIRTYNYENEIYSIKQQTENKEVALQNQIRIANHAHRRQNQQTQSKLGQRGRLSAEKKKMAEFLDEIDWKFTDGTKITYNALARLAKKHRSHCSYNDPKKGCYLIRLYLVPFFKSFQQPSI